MFGIEKYINLIIGVVAVSIISFIGWKLHSLSSQIAEKKIEIIKLEKKIVEEDRKRISLINKKNDLEKKYDELSKSVSVEVEESVYSDISLLTTIRNSTLSDLKNDNIDMLTIDVNKSNGKSSSDINIDAIYMMYENATGKRL